MANNTELRDQAILAARRRGAGLAELGRRYKLSREGVRQIYLKAERNAHGHSDPADELSARLRNALQAEGCKLTPAAVRKSFTYTTLRRVPNLGRLSITLLNEWLVRHGQQPITDEKHQ